VILYVNRSVTITVVLNIVKGLF